jgi:hypothetical protein
MPAEGLVNKALLVALIGNWILSMFYWISNLDFFMFLLSRDYYLTFRDLLADWLSIALLTWAWLWSWKLEGRGRGPLLLVAGFILVLRGFMLLIGLILHPLKVAPPIRHNKAGGGSWKSREETVCGGGRPRGVFLWFYR